MASVHETFWLMQRYAFVGHSASKPFPKLSYSAAKARGNVVYAIDPSVAEIDGDKTWPDLSALPGPVDGVVLEVPAAETAAWVKAAADAGIAHVWIHMGRETPEALAVAKERGIHVRTGTCAVQYLDKRFPHNIHKLLRKATGNW
jgi:predicted CoA-binding protein